MKSNTPSTSLRRRNPASARVTALVSAATAYSCPTVWFCRACITKFEKTIMEIGWAPSNGAQPASQPKPGYSPVERDVPKERVELLPRPKRHTLPGRFGHAAISSLQLIKRVGCKLRNQLRLNERPVGVCPLSDWRSDARNERLGAQPLLAADKRSDRELLLSQRIDLL